MIIVRRLERGDAPAWNSLWATYLRFYRQVLDPEVSAATFERLCGPSDEMRGLVACDGDAADDVIGFAHLLLHPSTWSTRPYCYLEDLVVAPAARGRGAGAALITAIYELADRNDWARVYWHTQEYNAPARALYDQHAHRTSFVKYER